MQARRGGSRLFTGSCELALRSAACRLPMTCHVRKPAPCLDNGRPREGVTEARIGNLERAIEAPRNRSEHRQVAEKLRRMFNRIEPHTSS